MEMVEITNYDDRIETVRADQIESVVEPGPSPHDGGAVFLTSGRRIALSSRGPGQAARIVRVLSELRA